MICHVQAAERTEIKTQRAKQRRSPADIRGSGGDPVIPGSLSSVALAGMGILGWTVVVGVAGGALFLKDNRRLLGESAWEGPGSRFLPRPTKRGTRALCATSLPRVKIP